MDQSNDARLVPPEERVRAREGGRVQEVSAAGIEESAGE
jgi:hypothetical protein